MTDDLVEFEFGPFQSPAVTSAPAATVTADDDDRLADFQLDPVRGAMRRLLTNAVTVYSPAFLVSVDDGEPCSLTSFVEANPEVDVTDVLSLEVGQSVVIGLDRVTRVCPYCRGSRVNCGACYYRALPEAI